jgi:hypothetical protein
MSDLFFNEATASGPIRIRIEGDHNQGLAYLTAARSLLGQMRSQYGINERIASGEPGGFYVLGEFQDDGTYIEATSNDNLDEVLICLASPPVPTKAPRRYRVVQRSRPVYSVWVYSKPDVDAPGVLVEHNWLGDLSGRSWPLPAVPTLYGFAGNYTESWGGDLIAAFDALWLVLVNRHDALPNAVGTLYRVDVATGQTATLELSGPFGWQGRCAFTVSESHVFLGYALETEWGGSATALARVLKIDPKTCEIVSEATLDDPLRASNGACIIKFVLLSDSDNLYVYWDAWWMDEYANTSLESQGITCAIISQDSFEFQITPRNIARRTHDNALFMLNEETSTIITLIGDTADYNNITWQMDTANPSAPTEFAAGRMIADELNADAFWSALLATYLACEERNMLFWGSTQTLEVVDRHGAVLNSATLPMPVGKQSNYYFTQYFVESAAWDGDFDAWLISAPGWDDDNLYGMPAGAFGLIRVDIFGRSISVPLPGYTRGVAIHFIDTAHDEYVWLPADDDDAAEKPHADLGPILTLEQLTVRSVRSRACRYSFYV